MSKTIEYHVNVGFVGEGYSFRNTRVKIDFSFGGEGDNYAKREEAKRKAIEAYTKNVSANVFGVASITVGRD